nr:ribonuclease H-like domain-containing protein [Tanacetum cinerariifolium]
MSRLIKSWWTYLVRNILTVLNEISDCCGLKLLDIIVKYWIIISSSSEWTLIIAMKKYACELLKRANMVNCNPSRTPVDIDSKLGLEGVAVQYPIAEAEYHDVANVVAEIAWLHNLHRELHSPLSTVTLVYCDNVSAVYLSINPVQHQRTKHIEIDIHFVRDMVQTGQIRVLHVPSCYQYADIFTK